jgi:predicted kinase
MSVRDNSSLNHRSGEDVLGLLPGTRHSSAFVSLSGRRLWIGVLSSPINDAGYRVGYAVAADNLHVGRTVIADSVNPIPLSRDAWLEVANRAQVSAVEIEVTCSDTKEHQHRVETRISDIARSRSLTWQDVVSRNYCPWNREHIVIDTASRTVEQVLTILRGAIPKQ